MNLISLLILFFVIFFFINSVYLLSLSFLNIIKLAGLLNRLNDPFLSFFSLKSQVSHVRFFFYVKKK